MDRGIVYPGSIPLETDVLNTNRNAMVGLAKLSAAIFGATSAVVNGLAVVPTGPASLQVLVNPGEIYSLQNLENSAYSSLAADTAHQIVKQGISLNNVTLSCPAPLSAGQSINYLIEAGYTDLDGTPVALPYYNASNPSVAWSGPNNSGTQQNTVRAGAISLIAKAGVAAPTNTQTTPSVDTGYVGLYVVTVANGQTTITSGNIAQVVGAPFLAGPVTSGRLINVQRFTSSGTYTPTPGTNSIIVEVQGGGGGGGGSGATGAGQLSAGSGGNSGSYARSRLTSGFAGAAVTVGAGGTASSASNGGAGGTSSFGSFVSAPGGGAGIYLGATAPPTIVFATNNTTSIGTGGNLINALSGTGTPGYLINISAVTSGSGGNSPFGSGPAGGPTPGPGISALANSGCGGAGGLTGASGSANTGGSGAAGIVLIWEYA